MKKFSLVLCGLAVASTVVVFQTSCSKKTQTDPQKETQPKADELNSVEQAKTAPGEQVKSPEEQLQEPFVVNLKDPIYVNEVVAKRLQQFQKTHPGIKLKCPLNDGDEIYQVEVIPLGKDAFYPKLRDDILDLMYQNREKKGVKLGPNDKIELNKDR